MPRLPRTRPAKREPLDYRPTTVHLTPELDDALSTEARAMGVSRSALVRIALQSWIADSNLSAGSRSASGAS